MQLWFWAWLIVAAGIAAASALAGDRASAPFAAGALAAAGIEAAGGTPALEWVAFIGLSSVLFVIFNRPTYRPRHSRRRSDSQSPDLADG